MSKELSEYIEERIKYLRKVEMKYFNESCDRGKPQHERDLKRRFSNEFQARRNELELLQTKTQ